MQNIPLLQCQGQCEECDGNMGLCNDSGKSSIAGRSLSFKSACTLALEATISHLNIFGAQFCYCRQPFLRNCKRGWKLQEYIWEVDRSRERELPKRSDGHIMCNSTLLHTAPVVAAGMQCAYGATPSIL